MENGAHAALAVTQAQRLPAAVGGRAAISSDLRSAGTGGNPSMRFSKDEDRKLMALVE